MDERDVLDVNAEEVELADFCSPAEVVRYCVRYPSIQLRVSFRHGAAAYLELTLAAVTVGDDAVDKYPRVTMEIPRLHRSEAHREPEIPVPEQGLDGADAG